MLGKVIGNYKLIAEIGRGAHGTVYRAFDQGRGREVALKQLHPHLTEHPAVNERLRTLAPSIAQLRHPQLAEFYTILQQGTDLYLVTELIEGQPLSDALQQAGVFPGTDAAELVRQICEPLVWLNRAGWAHGGLKPTNVRVTPAGSIKITDLGLAYALGNLGAQTSASGLAYRASEQLREVGFDARADVYALGAMLYELVTGLLPFRRINDEALRQAILEEPVASPRNYFPLIAAPLEELLLRALSKNPEHRFATPAELQTTLHTWLLEATPTTTKTPVAGAEKFVPQQFADATPTQRDTIGLPSSNRVSDALKTNEAPIPAGLADTTSSLPALATAAHTSPFATQSEENFVAQSGSLPVATPAASRAALYDEVVVELDEAVPRKRSVWMPLLAIAGLSALVGIPLAMMQGGNSPAPNLPPSSTLTVPSPTATLKTALEIAATPVARNTSTPRPLASPKAIATVLPKRVVATPTPVPSPKMVKPLPTPTPKVVRATPTPAPTPKEKKAAKPEPTPKEKKSAKTEPTPKVKNEKEKKKGVGGIFKDIFKKPY